MRQSIFREIYGVLVSEFQLTENAMAQPEAFAAARTQSIEDIEQDP
jgi:hypothetical protein